MAMSHHWAVAGCECTSCKAARTREKAQCILSTAAHSPTVTCDCSACKEARGKTMMGGVTTGMLPLDKSIYSPAVRTDDYRWHRSTAIGVVWQPSKLPDDVFNLLKGGTAYPACRAYTTAKEATDDLAQATTSSGKYLAVSVPEEKTIDYPVSPVQPGGTSMIGAMLKAAVTSALVVVGASAMLVGLGTMISFGALATGVITMEQVTWSLQWGLDTADYYLGAVGVAAGGDMLRRFKPIFASALRRWAIDLMNSATSSGN